LIGEIIPLTGPEAAGPGLYEQTGTTLAIRQINAHGGIHGRALKVIRADDRSTPAGAIAAFGRLVKSGHVTAIIAPNVSKENQAMTPSIKKAGVPVMIGGAAEIVTHEGDPWVFRTRPNGTYTARALSVFMVSTLHLSRIALLHSNDVAGSQGEADLLSSLKAFRVTPVVDQAFPNYASDLTAQVLAIKKSGAKALISYSTFIEDLLLLGRQMHQAGVHLTWLGNSNLGVVKLLRLGGPLLYGTYVVTDYAPGQSPEALAFDKTSKATLHLPGDFASGYAYDGLQILARVIRKVGIAPQAIRQAILSIRGYRGVMGTYNFDRYGEGLHQATVVQNVRGRLRVIKVLTF
jgi:branched-chain amino acid transport system substrate-binding protein